MARHKSDSTYCFLLIAVLGHKFDDGHHQNKHPRANVSNCLLLITLVGHKSTMGVVLQNLAYHKVFSSTSLAALLAPGP